MRSLPLTAPQLYQHIDIPSSSPGAANPANTMVLGHIRAIHIRNAVLAPDGTVDPEKLRAISRLGGVKFARVGQGFEIARPSWREIEGEVRELIKKSEGEA